VKGGKTSVRGGGKVQKGGCQEGRGARRGKSAEFRSEPLN